MPATATTKRYDTLNLSKQLGLWLRNEQYMVDDMAITPNSDNNRSFIS